MPREITVIVMMGFTFQVMSALHALTPSVIYATAQEFVLPAPRMREQRPAVHVLIITIKQTIAALGALIQSVKLAKLQEIVFHA